MAAYLGRFEAPIGTTTWGLGVIRLILQGQMFLGPRSAAPWSLDNRRKMGFTALGHDAGDAMTKLHSILAKLANRDFRPVPARGSSLSTMDLLFGQARHLGLAHPC